MITILIVDDEEEVLFTLHDIVSKQKSEEMTLLTSTFSQQAKDLLQTQVIDILISDINMPGLNGFDLSVIAKKNNPQCRVIFITGYDNFEYAYNALKGGCDDFILKINSEAEIFNSISKTIVEIKKEKKLLEAAMNLERLNQLSKPASQDINKSDPIAYVKNYIWTNFNKEISLNLLASTVYLHPAYLSRLFKQTTNVTITDYLSHVRIEKAKELLLEAHMKIQDISHAVGIESPVYFGRIFKKETGLTPQEYRQTHSS
jgi:two-component system, response regulator YesN